MSGSAYTTQRVDDIPRGLIVAVLLAAVAAFFFRGDVAAQDPGVASFDAIAPDNPPGDAGEATRGGDATAANLSFSFRFAPWEDVLTKFADVAGLTLDLTDVPAGTFNYYDKGRYTTREALDILNGYLLQRGFVLVRRDRFLVCVNLEKGIPENLIPMVTVEQLADYGKNELVSAIFAFDGFDASLAASQIGQLQGQQGKVVSLNATNSLLITDTAGNLRLIKRLRDAGAFERPTSGNAGPSFKSFALEYVRAAEAERLIRTLFGLPPALSASSAADGVAATDATNLTQLSITTDARTNRLFVTATRDKLASIEQIVADYDVADPSSSALPQRRSTTTRIVPLPNADVIIIGRALESLSPRIRVSTTRSARSSAAAVGESQRPSPDEPASESPVGATSPTATPESPNGRDG